MLIGLVLLAFFPISAFGQSSPEFKTRLDAIVSQYMESRAFVGLHIGLIRNGSEPQIYTYGEVVKGSGRKPSPSTLFQIGSLTKTFTGLQLALLAERGIVRLEDPLQRYVPDGTHVPKYWGRPILLFHLATHTSGLPRNAPLKPNQQKLTLDEMYGLLSRVQLGSEPGQHYLYSNWGFALLAEALVRVARAGDYQLLVQREVLSKLGMVDTTLRPGPDLEARVAPGYTRTGRRAARDMPNWPAFNGAGALYSTMADMLNYLGFNLSLTETSMNSTLRVVHQPRVRTSPNQSIALGWEIRKQPPANITIIEKGGGTLGFRSYLAFIPEQSTGVVILANSVGTEAVGIGRDILTLLARNP